MRGKAVKIGLNDFRFGITPAHAGKRGQMADIYVR